MTNRAGEDWLFAGRSHALIAAGHHLPWGGSESIGSYDVTADPLDAEITRQVLAVLSGPGLAAAVADHAQDDGGALGDELACEARLEQLAGDSPRAP